MHNYRRIFVISVFFCMITEYAFAGSFESVLSFIERRNPQFKIFEEQKKWYNSIGFNIELSNESAGLKVVIPILSRKEFLESDKQYNEYRQNIRKELIRLLKEYYSAKEYIQSENIAVSDLEKEIVWIQQRVDTGIDSPDLLIQKTMAFKQRKSLLKIKMNDLNAIFYEISTYIPLSDRNELKRIIDE